MTSKAIPDELPITVEGACNISLECWRLSRIAELLKDSSEGMALRHVAQSINEALNVIDIEIVDFAGRIYDPGMVPEVVEVRLPILANNLFGAFFANCIAQYLKFLDCWRSDVILGACCPWSSFS